MQLAPLFASPCDLAERVPPLVADFLDLETSLGRRFREESISDILVACLLRLSGPELLVLVPKDEKRTGSDFDIMIRNPRTGKAIQYRIQAKRLTPHPSNWEKGSYVNLAHPHGTGAQSRTLVRSAASTRTVPTIPLYAFYNPMTACVASGSVLAGVQLASGWSIRHVVRTLIAAKPKRPPLKRVSSLLPLFFPLSAVLCPPKMTQKRRVPTPEESLKIVSDHIEEATARFFNSLRIIEYDETLHLLDKQSNTKQLSDVAITSKLSEYLDRIIERRVIGQAIRADVKRPLVLLLSDHD